MSTFEATLHQLPEPILNKLKAIIGRVRRLLFIRGFFATLAVGLACLVGIMTIDATVTLFSSAARWALSLTGLAVTLVTAWWFLLRPLSRKITLTHIARILEIRHPELQERISTAVELMSSQDPDSVRGSEELINAVVDSAVVDVGTVDPKTEFKGGRASRFVLMAGVSVAVLAIFFAIFPRQAGVLIARALAPFLDIGNAWADTLSVNPGDVRVAIGQPVTIEMTVRHDKLRRAEIRRKLADGSEAVERMTLMGETPDGAKRFSITFPMVDESFDYRVQGGSAVSEFYRVDAVPKPVVETLTLRYEFPAYTNREPVEVVGGNGEISALAHTQVTVTAAMNKPVSEAKLDIVGVPLESQPTIAEGQVSWQFALAPRIDSRWRMNFKDADGFESDPSDHPIVALPDLAPKVKITAPSAKELRLRPSELVPIQYAVTEDIGLSEVTLLVTPAGEAVAREIPQPTPDSDGQPGTWRGVASLNLASLDLAKHQKSLTAQIRVRDNLPAEYEGPNEGFSDKLTIIIDSGAKTLAEQTLAAQKEEIRQAIEEAKKDLYQAKSEVQQAEQNLKKDEKVTPEAMRKLDEFKNKANEAQETLREVAKKTENTVFQPQGEQLEKVAEEQVADAREAADMIPMTDQKDQRVAEARTAQKEVDQAIEELKKVEKTLNDSDKEMQMVAELNELANEQRQLAQEASKQAEQQQQANPDMNQRQQQKLTEEQQRQLAEFQKEQEQIQRELGEKLTESPEALRDILAKQQQQAAQLAEQAKAMAEQQEQLAQMTENAAKPEAAPQEAFKDQLVASLQKMQEKIAEETNALKQQLNEQQPEAGKPLENAGEQTQQAAETLKQENMPAASEAAKQAAEALAQASEKAEAMAQEAQPGATEPGAPEGQPENRAPQTPEMAQAEGQAPQSPAGETPASPEGQPQPQPGTPEPAPAPAPETDPQMAQAQAQTPTTPEGAQPGEPQAAPQPGESPQPGEQAQAQAPQPPADEPPGAPAPEGQDPAMAQQPQPQAPSPLAAEPARQQLAQLAEQQEMVAQQLQAIEAGQLQEALAMMEQQVAEGTEALQQQAEALEQATEAAQQQGAKSKADQAENALANAAQQAQQASQQLAQAQEAQDAGQPQGQSQGQPQSAGQPTPQAQQAMNQSKGQQQQAQQGMNQAAQALQQASDMLGQALANMETTPQQQSDVLNPEDLASAFDDTTQSAQSQDAQQAAQNAQQAAQSLQQLAQAAMEKLGANGQPGQQPNQPGQPQPNQPPQFVDGADPQLNESGMKTADINGDGIPPELKALGISAADWARLKGSLQSGGAAQGGDDLPAEYRDLVGRYFQVIAREAGKAE